jgi:hypothetical protein
MKNAMLSTVWALILAIAAPAGAAVVNSYEIDATFRPADASVHALVRIGFTPGSAGGGELVFYLHGELGVDSILAGGNRVDFTQERVFHEDDYSLVANRVAVHTAGLDLAGGIVVGYSGPLNPSVVKARSNYMRVDSGGVFLRSLGYSLWFPVFVDSWRKSHETAFPRVVIRTPEPFTAVFAGKRIRAWNEAGLNVSEWSADRLELFAAQCTARPFELLREGGLHLYHLPSETSGRKAGDIAAFAARLESVYAEYYRRAVSAEQLHIAQMPRYGDISSGNMIGISDEVWNRFEATDWQGLTVAHELVHPYVRVPCSPEMEAFVIEGFPGYFYLPALAGILGEDWYAKFLARTERAYINRRETGKNRRGARLPEEKPILDIGAAEIGTYKDTFVLNDRVRLFFDFLRRRMGNARFFEFATALVNEEFLDYATLEKVIENHLPGSSGDVRTWLRTSDFPAGFRIDGSEDTR